LDYISGVNRRRALFRLAALPGALGAAFAYDPRAQAQSLPDVSLTPEQAEAGMAPISRTVMQAAATSSAAHPGVDDLLFRALSLVGTPYHPGGISPQTGFDCSGYVSYLFHEVFDMSLPRMASQIVQHGSSVSRDALQPGDLVFFNTMRRPYTHVGIYIGDDRFIHAPASGGLVRTENLNERYWVKRWDGARRIIAPN
jgi:cell wall-associated NlpC family hydrolase